MGDASFNAQMATDATPEPARDLILGLTQSPSSGGSRFPGMVAMSKVAPPDVTFAQADLAGPWRIYMQRVESKLTSSTWQVGQSVFSGAGAFTAATVVDVASVATTLTTGSLAVASDGAVAGTLRNAAGTHIYQITGTMRAAKDLITGVVTARTGAATFQGLVTLVRDVTVLGLGQASYAVAEKQLARITVTRTGNQAGTVTVNYAVTGGSAPSGDYTLSGTGTLTFGPNAQSRTIDLKANDNLLLDGSRSVVLTLSDPSGAGVLLGEPAEATVTILDNDVGGAVRVAGPPAGVVEGGAAVFTLTRSGGAAGNVSVGWVAADGTARAATADYTGASGTVTFGPGETTKQIQVQTLADSAVEGDETFRVLLQNPSGLVLGTPVEAAATILDAQQGLQFAAVEYTVSEATPTAAVTVLRTGPATGAVTVRYSTSPGNATPGADYTPVDGVLTFAANVRTATFKIPIVNDALLEGPETVLLTLSDPSPPAQLGPRFTATLTILDNDVAGAVRLSAAAYTVAEGAGAVTITVQRVGNAGGITVDYQTGPITATPGEDYLTAFGTLTFGPNEMSRTFTVPILNDSRDEPNETFRVALFATAGTTLGSPRDATVTITDDDVPGTVALGAATVTVAETAGVATVTVTRTGGAAGGVTVDYASSDGSATAGSDYTGVAGTLTFSAGETSKRLAIAIADDMEREGNETVLLTLSNPGGGAALGTLRNATLTITDNEVGPTVQFKATAYSVAENAGTVTLTVTRTGSTAAGQSVRVRTATGGGGLPATPGVHFGALDFVLTFPAGQTSVSVPVGIAPDGDFVGDRTFVVELLDATGGLSVGVPRRAVVTIQDDDALVQLASSSVTVVEGGTAMLTVQRTGATSIKSTVRYATTNGSALAPGDYTAKAGVLSFGPGVTSLSVPIVTLNDVLAEGDETFTVTLSQPTGATLGAGVQATVTIQDDDAPGSAGTVQFGAPAVTVLEGGVATITVTRSGGNLGPATVSFTTSVGGSATGGSAPGPGIDYVAKTATLTFAAGKTTQTVTVQTVADTLLEGAETVILALAVPPSSPLALGAQATSTLTIVDDEQPRVQFTVPATTVAEGAGSVTLTVQRLGPTTGNHSVNYTLAGVSATAGTDFGGAGGTLLFPPGVTSRTITVPIVADTLSEAAETFTVTLTGPGGGAALGLPAQVTVTITDDDPAGTVQFAASSYSVVEGGAVTLTVTRTGGTAGPVTVAWSLSPGSALAGADYVSQSGVLTFAAAQTSREIVVATLSDAAVEGSQSFEVVLGTTSGGLVHGATARARVWILDQAQTLQFGATGYTVLEGGAALIAVTRVGVPAGTVGATVTLGGVAQAGVDYVSPGPIVLTFGPGVATQTFTIQTLPDSVVEPGGRALTLMLSGLTGGAVAGTPAAVTLTIVDNDRPDLVVTSLSNPAQVATGLPMTVTATVRNQAGAPAPASRLGLYLEADDGSGPSILIGTLPTPALMPLASTTVTGAVSVPTAGALLPIVEPYRLFAVADVTEVVVEADETNNVRFGGVFGVVELMPDLLVTGVPSPGGTLSGKLLSAPLHVRNAGLVASGPYRVGVFLSQNQSSTDGALLLAVRDMPSLPPGAGVDVPLSVTVPDDLAQGAYYLTGVADLLDGVLETDEVNNALSSAVAFQVTRNLTKLTRVNATFTLADLSAPTSALAVTSCQLAPQDLSLTGTLNLATQTGTTGQGTIVLTGTVASGGTVTFRGTFNATVNADDTVAVSLSLTASGAFTGTATASGTGSITEGVLTASITGGLLTVTSPLPAAGSCPFTGSLTVRGEPTIFFSLLYFTQAGWFNTSGVAAPPYPLAITEGSVGAAVLFDPAPPLDPFFVRFTGPAGSGVTNVPASLIIPNAAGSFYETDTASVAGRNVVGKWTVNYGNRLIRSFTVGNPDAEARFIAMVPTLTVVPGTGGPRVTAVSWVFKDRLTGATVPAPLHADSIQVELAGSFAGIGPDPVFGYYASPDFPRTTTSHTLPAPVPFGQIEEIYISFKDTLTGNFYVTSFVRP